jgi:hypothetical protein
MFLRVQPAGIMKVRNSLLKLVLSYTWRRMSSTWVIHFSNFFNRWILRSPMLARVARAPNHESGFDPRQPHQTQFRTLFVAAYFWLLSDQGFVGSAVGDS